MDIFYFLFAIKARAKLIALITLSFLLVVVAFSLLIPKTYKATSTVLLSHKSFDPVTGAPTPTQLITGFVDTQRDIIISKATALKVAEELRLAERQPVLDNLDVDRVPARALLLDRIAERLLKKLEIQSSRESSVLKISFKSHQPETAAEVANAFAAAYQAANLRLKNDPLRKASGAFQEQLKSLRAELDDAQTRLARYRKENRLLTDVHDADVEVARLNEVSTELVQIENALVDAKSKRANARRDIDASPTVANDDLVRELRADLARAESKFASVKPDLMPEHPKYIALKAEVDRLRSDLNAYARSSIKTIVNQIAILSQRRAEIGDALNAQRTRVLELNMARDKLAVLTQDVDNAKRAYEAASRRYSQIHVENHANQPDVNVIHSASTPASPASPRLLLNALIGTLAGLLAGIGIALLYEMKNPRILTMSDIVHELGIPLLGQIHWHCKKPTNGILSFSRLALSR